MRVVQALAVGTIVLTISGCIGRSSSRIQTKVLDALHEKGAPNDIAGDLERCFVDLDSKMAANAGEQFRTRAPEDILASLSPFVVPLEKRWNLWGGSKLALDFEAAGVDDADRVVSIVLTDWIHRKLGEPLEYLSQIARYRSILEEDEGIPSITIEEIEQAAAGDITLPVLTANDKERRPMYPQEMIILQQEAVVTAAFVVPTTGVVRRIRFLSGRQEFWEAVYLHLTTVRFDPALRNGKPIAIRVIVKYRFRLTGMR